MKRVKDQINVYFKAATLPVMLEENWDADVLGYYVGTSDVITSGDWTYSLTDDDKASIISYKGNDTDIVLDKIDGYDVVSIGGGAFLGNKTISSIQLPETLTGIYASAFKGTRSLEEITIPKNVLIIDSEAFRDSGLSSISFENGSALKSLGQYAFANTNNLTDFVIPSELDNIKSYTFYKSGLSSVSFADNSQVAEIGRYAFAESALSSIIIPDSVNKIDYYAFSETDHLENLQLGTNSSQMLMGHAFYKSGIKSVNIPAGVKYIGEECFTSCKRLTSITVADANDAYSSVEGVLFDKEKTQLITCPAGMTGSYDVEASVQ